MSARQLRHRQVAPAHRDRHRHRRERPQGPLHDLSKALYRYSRYDLLCLDEFGYLNLDRTGAKLLFQIFTEREERKAIAVASNAPFSEWDKTFADERLCLAITDRLTFNGYLIETGEDSYRLQSTLERQQT